MTSKMTLSKVQNFFKSTKGECALSVISFNMDTHVREFAYGGNNCIDSFCAMANEAAHGKIVVLTDKEGWDYLFKFELEKDRRITYEEFKSHVCLLSNEGHIW